MTQPCILIVESDVIVRHPLAEFLRECGYMVLEAVDGTEARVILSDDKRSVHIVLADANAPDESGFVLSAWIRSNCPGVMVILAGTVVAAVNAAGDLCDDGPALSKPYDHQLVLQHIRRAQATRDRRAT
jgi:DNA-binding response OmpR family regulator